VQKEFGLLGLEGFWQWRIGPVGGKTLFAGFTESLRFCENSNSSSQLLLHAGNDSHFQKIGLRNKHPIAKPPGKCRNISECATAAAVAVDAEDAPTAAAPISNQACQTPEVHRENKSTHRQIRLGRHAVSPLPSDQTFNLLVSRTSRAKSRGASSAMLRMESRSDVIIAQAKRWQALAEVMELIALCRAPKIDAMREIECGTARSCGKCQYALVGFKWWPLLHRLDNSSFVDQCKRMRAAG